MYKWDTGKVYESVIIPIVIAVIKLYLVFLNIFFELIIRGIIFYYVAIPVIEIVFI